jgi:hypothetical protein
MPDRPRAAGSRPVPAVRAAEEVQASVMIDDDGSGHSQPMRPLVGKHLGSGVGRLQTTCPTCPTVKVITDVPLSTPVSLSTHGMASDARWG